VTRPDILTPLFASLPSLKGVGPRNAALMAKLFGAAEGQDASVVDALFHMPVTVVDRRAQSGVAKAVPGQIVTLKLTIDAHQAPPPGGHRMPYKVSAHDGTGPIELAWFVAKAPWLEKALPVGAERYVSGTISQWRDGKQMVHPDYMVAPEEFDELPQIEPIYPMTRGLSAKVLRKAIAGALAALPDLPEWIAPARLTGGGWPSFGAALAAVHRPQSLSGPAPDGAARSRLAYDEYLAGQLALALMRQTMTRNRGVVRKPTGELTGRIVAALPFELTDGQRNAFAEIKADLGSAHRMARLLQGDVGAGKTLVALLAMAAVAEAGAQSALMAPTELLAAQHFRTIKPLCEAAGIGCVLLTGKLEGADKRAGLAAIASGEAAIAVGTHALFQSAVSFADLGLSVVDEQHRFGVHQRLALSEKGRRADLLVMTATPIPRTLVLSHFGDMDVSKLPERPAGRQPIETAVLPATAYERVVARLRARVAEGAQAFWVCPLVEESERVPAVSAEERYRALGAELGDRVGLVHGRMGAAEKQALMERFISGDISVMVATTVIEVGVDVPNATIMIIEHAERFGLAQLHQLRGRVGRGAKESACVLLHGEPLGKLAAARLETIRTTEDGFEIAEKDLELRGAGDVLGTRQSGMPDYRLALPEVHGPILRLAHEDARAILTTNPGLQGPEGDAMRALLYLFRRDLAVGLVKAG